MDSVMEDKRIAAWSKVVTAILHYQSNHRGLSPSDEMIAVEAGMTRDAVRAAIREMEDKGIVTDSKRWPRIIKVNKQQMIDRVLDKIDPKQKPVTAQEAGSIGGKLSAARLTPEQRVERASKAGRASWVSKNLSSEQRSEWGRRMAEARRAKRMAAQPEDTSQVVRNKEVKMEHGSRSFFERAKAVAEAIDDLTDKLGMPPTGAMIRAKVGYASSSGLTGVTNRMVEEGWLLHKSGCHSDYRLTNLGRTVLLHSAPVEQPNNLAEPVPERRPELPKAPQASPEPRTAPPASVGYPSVTFRGIVPDKAPEQDGGRTETYVAIPNLTKVDSLDMALELQRRGWRVTR